MMMLKTSKPSEENPNEESEETPATIYLTQWFVGLEFVTSSETAVDLNLTDTFQSFTDLSKIPVSCLNQSTIQFHFYSTIQSANRLRRSA